MNEMELLLAQMKEISAPTWRITFFKEKILPALPAYPPVDRDYIVAQVAKLLKPAGVTLPAIRKMVKLEVGDEKELKEQKAEPLAVFPGLVDIVEQAGEPAFLMGTMGTDGKYALQAVKTVTVGERPVCPPERTAMPWLLPRYEEVMKYYREDDDRQLLADLISYHQEISDLPSPAHYLLLAVFDMLSFLQEKILYLPILCFYGVPERGKSRTGKGIIYVAYRGIHETTVRDTHLVRYCAEYKATLFLDTMDLWRRVEKQGSEDIILGRFEKGQVVRRVLWPERGLYRDSQYYEIFGPTLIATNRSVDAILETRALSINLPEAGRKFNGDIRPENSLPFRERLVAFRARHMTDSLPDVKKPVDGRLGDITRPLVQITEMVNPDLTPDMLALIEEFRQQRLADKADSLEAQVFMAFLSCEEHVLNGVLPVAVVAKKVNENRETGKELSSQRVGRILTALGLKRARMHRSQKAYIWPSELEKNLIANSLGLTQDNVSNVSNVKNPGKSSPPVETLTETLDESEKEMSPDMSPEKSLKIKPSGHDGDNGDDGDINLGASRIEKTQKFSEVNPDEIPF